MYSTPLGAFKQQTLSDKVLGRTDIVYSRGLGRPFSKGGWVVIKGIFRKVFRPSSNTKLFPVHWNVFFPIFLYSPPPCTHKYIKNEIREKKKDS